MLFSKLHPIADTTCDTSGTPALTSRGFVEKDFVKVAECFDAAVKLALKIKEKSSGLIYNDISAIMHDASNLRFKIHSVQTITWYCFN